jgi:hypothetical protein
MSGEYFSYSRFNNLGRPYQERPACVCTVRNLNTTPRDEISREWDCWLVMPRQTVDLHRDIAKAQPSHGIHSSDNRFCPLAQPRIEELTRCNNFGGGSQHAVERDVLVEILELAPDAPTAAVDRRT